MGQCPEALQLRRAASAPPGQALALQMTSEISEASLRLQSVHIHDHDQHAAEYESRREKQ